MGKKALEMDLRELLGRESTNWLVRLGSWEENLEGREEAGRVEQALSGLDLVCCRRRRRCGGRYRAGHGLGGRGFSNGEFRFRLLLTKATL